MIKESNKTLRVFKNTWFERFTHREKITDEVLVEAIARAEKGIIDANLGGKVIKQRIARLKQGKSSGYRTIIVFKDGDKAFFVYGFAKNKQENIDKNETNLFKKLAKELLSLSDENIQELIKNEALIEINYD